MKYVGHRVKYSPSVTMATVTLVGITPFTRRRVEIEREVYFRFGATRRQILVAAAKQSGYRWNIPFWV